MGIVDIYVIFKTVEMDESSREGMCTVKQEEDYEELKGILIFKVREKQRNQHRILRASGAKGTKRGCCVTEAEDVFSMDHRGIMSNSCQLWLE